MKTITIKLPDEQAKKLDDLLKNKYHISKSEFVRQLIISKLESLSKEKFGWMALAESSLKKLWENKKDKEIWKKHL